MRTKAEFRALRAMVGYSQTGFARAMGVEVRSVKRWESPTAPQYPPEPAWAILDAAMDRQQADIGLLLTADDGPITLTYWSSQQEYNAAGRRGDYTQANATARALAAILWDRGIEVIWADGGNVDYSPRHKD